MHSFSYFRLPFTHQEVTIENWKGTKVKPKAFKVISRDNAGSEYQIWYFLVTISSHDDTS